MHFGLEKSGNDWITGKSFLESVTNIFYLWLEKVAIKNCNTEKALRSGSELVNDFL